MPIFDPTRYGQPTAGGLTNAGHFDATYPVVLSEKPGYANGRPALIHMINGKASPGGAMFQVQTGWVVKMHIVNNTGEWHPMHLHGHVFTVLSANGHPPLGSPIQLDTVQVGPYETWDVAFVANNPGFWMFHCHVLLHAFMGMDAMIAYTNVSTPYRIGANTGNNPDG
jgi:FtsP/CotA-like multicopper oxidase with cupredoxin domain